MLDVAAFAARAAGNAASDNRRHLKGDQFNGKFRQSLLVGHPPNEIRLQLCHSDSLIYAALRELQQPDVLIPQPL